MMAADLRIKRGAVSGLPSGAAGEPLFTTDQFRLYVGSAGGNRLVGVFDKIDGTTAPTVNDDAGDGYSPGSEWIDTTNDKSYVCVDATVGAAVWQQTGGTGSGTPASITVTTANGLLVTGGTSQTVLGSGTFALTLPVTLAGSGTITNSGSSSLTGFTGNGALSGGGTVATGGFTLTVGATASISGTNTGDQTITLTGDVTGSGTGSFAATLATVATAGTYDVVTVDAKGRVTAGSGAASTAPPSVPGLRLTLTTALPVTTTDVTGATTIYYTPLVTNAVSLWTGSVWAGYRMEETALLLGAVTSGANYDVFVYDAGTPAVPVVAATATGGSQWAASNVTANIPASTAGDKLLVLLAFTSGGGFTTPATWTLADTATNGTVILNLYTKTSAGGAATTQVFTVSSGTPNVCCTALAVTGYTGTDYSLSALLGTASSGTVITAPAFTPTGKGRVLVTLYASQGSATTMGAVPGTQTGTTVVNANSGGTQLNVRTGYESLPADYAGAVGTRAVTMSGGTITSAIAVQIVVNNGAAGPTLEKLVWTNDTTRATGISVQDGRYCKTGDKTRLYVGTFRTTSTTTTADSEAARFVWNYYNRFGRHIGKRESADSWTYQSTTWRPTNNSTANKVEWVNGAAEDAVEVTMYGESLATMGDGGTVGVAVDNTTYTNTAQVAGFNYDNGVTVSGTPLIAQYRSIPAVGYHYATGIERCVTAAAALTFYGDAAAPGVYGSGLMGEVKG